MNYTANADHNQYLSLNNKYKEAPVTKWAQEMYILYKTLESNWAHAVLVSLF